MPIRDENNKKWLCEGCKTSFKYKKEAKACEQKHKVQEWLKAWANNEIDDQELADFLGIDVESVRLMTVGGIDVTLSEKKPGERMMFHGGIGTLENITKMHSDGRTQVPHTIRKEMGLKDGDTVYWYKSPDGRFYIDNIQVTSDFPRGKEILVNR